MSNGYDSADHAEKATADNLERQRTAGGHIDDRTQPSLPVVHRTFANPAPLGLLSFATGIFLISMFGVHARSLTTPNVLIGVLMFFGGLCQFISGIMEFVAGNTFGATVFPSYGAFNLSYAMIYIPGTGILDAYIDPSTGLPNSQFGNALAMYCWAWFILTVVFTVAAMRSSWILFMDLAILCVELLLLACGYMTGTDSVLTAANSLGFVVAFLSCTFSIEMLTVHANCAVPDWAGCAGLWSSGLTPINLPTFAMYKEKK